MNYDDFIDRVNDKVRTDDEWPESGSVTQEQVDISYIAALAVASVMPLSAFPSGDFINSELTGGTTIFKQLVRYDMPDDVFRYRDDLGIASIEINSFEYALSESIPIELLRAKARNELYKDAVLFSVDTRDRRIVVHAANKTKLNYLAEFDKPATTDIGTTSYPLDGTDAERAASVAATHVLGELRRDNAGAQFQSILSRQYQTRRGQSQPETESNSS